MLFAQTEAWASGPPNRTPCLPTRRGLGRSLINHCTNLQGSIGLYGAHLSIGDHKWLAGQLQLLPVGGTKNWPQKEEKPPER